MVRAILKEFEVLGWSLSFKLVHFIYKLTGLAGQYVQMKSALSLLGRR